MALTHHVTGCSTAAADDGVIYLVNMWTPDGPPTSDTAQTGSVVRYDVDRGSASIVVDGLNFPSMLAVSRDRTLYVSANSVCPATGGPSANCDIAGSHNSGVLLKITPSEAGR
jgi:sugar lactone lactonase YvrE